MGAIRLTAKVLKLTGEVLDSDNFERWLLGKGGALFDRKLKDTSAKWFAGESRARRKVRNEIMRDIDSPEFMAALDEQLNQLPKLLRECAARIFSSTVNELFTGESTSYRNVLVVCPRSVIVRIYADQVVESLKNSAALEKYSGLAEVLLERVAGDFEKSYFLDDGRSAELGKNAKVVTTGTGTAWGLGPENGHYYVGITANNLSNREERKKFDKFCNESVAVLKPKIGRLTPEQMDKVRNGLRAIFKLDAATAQTA
jgi:hypothetical protein